MLRVVAVAYALRSSAPLPFSSSLMTAAAIRIVQAFQHIEKNGVVWSLLDGCLRAPPCTLVSLLGSAGALLTGSLSPKTIDMLLPLLQVILIRLQCQCD